MTATVASTIAHAPIRTAWEFETSMIRAFDLHLQLRFRQNRDSGKVAELKALSDALADAPFVMKGQDVVPRGFRPRLVI